MIVLAAAVVLWIAIWSQVSDWFDDGFNLGPNRESLGIVALSLPEVYILTWVTTLIYPSGNQIIGILQVDMWTVVLGLLLALRWGPLWLRTYRASDRATGAIRTTGLFVSVLFGVALSTALVVATHPEVATLDWLYQYHLNLASNFLRQFQSILGLSIPDLPIEAVDQMGEIFENNFILSLRAGALGLIGGLLVFGVPLILIMAVNAAVIFGAFVGILARNSIAIASGAGEALLAPVVSYLSGMGLLIAGHAFHEFMAIVVIGVGSAWVALEFRDRSSRPTLGVSVVILGLIQLGIASFLEVFVSSPIVNALLGYITVETDIVPVGDWYLVGALSMVATTAALAWVVAWMIRTTTDLMEDTLG